MLREMFIVLRDCVGTQKRGRESGRRVVMGWLLRKGVVLHGDASIVVCALFFTDVIMFSREICNSFEVRSDLLIKEGDFVQPVLKDYDCVDTFFINRSEMSEFISKVSGHVDFKFCTESSDDKLRCGADEEVITVHDMVCKSGERFGIGHLRVDNSVDNRRLPMSVQEVFA